MAIVYPAPGDLIPHRSPMLLLRAVLTHEAWQTECEGLIDAAFARACGGKVSTAFALELIAQTAAVHHGLRQRSGPGEFARAARGLLLGSRRLRLETRMLPVGEPLRVTISDDSQMPATGGMIRFEGRITDAAGRCLATGDATVLESRTVE